MVTESTSSGNLSDLLASLDVEESRYVMKRAVESSDRSARQKAGLSYNWLVAHGKDRLNKIAAKLYQDVGLLSLMKFTEALPRATDEIIEELEHRDVKIRNAAATQIVDRVIGKPPQKQEISGKEGGPVTLRVVYDTKESPKE
jgi:hypothetical protein